MAVFAIVLFLCTGIRPHEIHSWTILSLTADHRLVGKYHSQEIAGRCASLADTL